jgi:hypothetical protein
MSTDSRRLSILTAQEIDDLYGLPRFTEDDRHLHFDLSRTERRLVDRVRTMSAAVHLILQLGYFKAKSQFFALAREAVMGDLEHIVGIGLINRLLRTRVARDWIQGRGRSGIRAASGGLIEVVFGSR